MRTSKEERIRETWSRIGVLTGDLSAPVLTFNLRASDQCRVGRMLRLAAEMAQPLHLSLRVLLNEAPDWGVAGVRIFVCENPTVIAMAADRLGCACAPIICTDGMPAGAQRTLLTQLSAGGARLLYHGDFDWPGIRIGNHVMRTFGATPWRFSAGDYRPETGFALVGDPVDAPWDSLLAPRMSAVNLGLHEEAVVDDLLIDLAI